MAETAKNKLVISAKKIVTHLGKPVNMLLLNAINLNTLPKKERGIILKPCKTHKRKKDGSG